MQKMWLNSFGLVFTLQKTLLMSNKPFVLHQIGDLFGKFRSQMFSSLTMVTRMVAAWGADLCVHVQKTKLLCSLLAWALFLHCNFSQDNGQYARDMVLRRCR